MTAVVRSAPPIGFSRVELTEDACEAATRVLRSGWLTMGEQVLRFEEELAALVRAKHAVAVSSCTAALELSLRGLRLAPGARVLVPTMTFCGAVHAIIHSGYRPVLVDSDPVTAMVTEDTVADAVDRAGRVDAMMVLHFAGYPAPVEALAAAAGLPLTRVVEDAAHAIGAWNGTRPVGATSIATCFSFYATKNLPIGEGGMITTDDDELASYARKARLHGMSEDAWSRYSPGGSWRYSVSSDGYKANMTDVQAAIGRAQLRHFPAWQDRREAIARHYTGRLADCDGLVLPPRPKAGKHSWHLYVLQIAPAFGMDRNEFVKRLGKAGIACSVHFIPTHHHRYFRDLLATEGRSFSGADQAAERVCSLPLYPSLTRGETDQICDEIAALSARNGR